VSSPEPVSSSSASSSSERPKSKSLKPLRALLPFLAPYNGRMAIALVALLIAAGAMLALPVALKNVIDEGFSAANAAAIDRYFVLLLIAAGVFAAFASLRFYLVGWIGERVVADIRSAVYKRVIRMDPAFFEVTKTGEVLSRLTTDTTLIQSLSGAGLSILLRSSLSFVGSLVLMLYTSPRLALIIFALVPTVLVPMILFGRRVRRLSRDSQDRVADTSGLAGETLNAIQTVQAFTLEELHGARYDTAVEDSFFTAIRRMRVRAWMIAAAVICVFGSVTLVLWLGARSVLDGTMTGGELAQFLSYAIFMASSVAALSEMWGEMQRAAGAMERTVELLGSRPSIVTPATPVALPAGRFGRDERASGAISFDHLSFSYPSRPAQRALDDFHLDIAPGETVAFVGPSGAGKSTVFQLMLRFYDPLSGRILIDGVDLSTARAEDVRARIGLVPQETMIFGATPPTRTSKRPPARRRPMSSSASCPRASIRSWARRAPACRAARNSASRSRAPSSRIRRSCCSTRRRARSIRKARGSCRTPSRSSCATARPWSSPTASRPPSTRTGSWSSSAAASPAWDATRNCCATTRCTPGSRRYNSASFVSSSGETPWPMSMDS
jgi:ATP-binding cassette subfamily B protein